VFVNGGAINYLAEMPSDIRTMTLVNVAGSIPIALS